MGKPLTEAEFALRYGDLDSYNDYGDRFVTKSDLQRFRATIENGGWADEDDGYSDHRCPVCNGYLDEFYPDSPYLVCYNRNCELYDQHVPRPPEPPTNDEIDNALSDILMQGEWGRGSAPTDRKWSPTSEWDDCLQALRHAGYSPFFWISDDAVTVYNKHQKPLTRKTSPEDAARWLYEQLTKEKA